MLISLKYFKSPVVQTEIAGNIVSLVTGWTTNTLSIKPSLSAPMVVAAESVTLWGLLILHEIREGRGFL